MMIAATVISIIIALVAPTPIWLRRNVAKNMKVDGISVAPPGPALVILPVVEGCAPVAVWIFRSLAGQPASAG